MTRKTNRRQQIRPDLVTQATAARMIGIARQNVAGFIARGELEAEMVAEILLVTKKSALRVAAARKKKQAEAPDSAAA